MRLSDALMFFSSVTLQIKLALGKHRVISKTNQHMLSQPVCTKDRHAKAYRAKTVTHDF
jgi:hypothetical protein